MARYRINITCYVDVDKGSDIQQEKALSLLSTASRETAGTVLIPFEKTTIQIDKIKRVEE